jgi:DNA-binding MarR family transcriptional regulator
MSAWSRSGPAAAPGRARAERAGWRPRRPGAAALIAALALLFAAVVVRTAWVADDAFITFRTVHNALDGYGLRWNPAERVQTYTHPLWMLARLSRGPASVSELARPLPMSLPAVLQHLKALEDSGLIRTEKKGRVRTAQIQGNAIAEAEQWLTDRRTEWEAQADRLEVFLGKLQGDQ